MRRTLVRFGEWFQPRLAAWVGRPAFWGIALPLLIVHPLVSALTAKPAPRLPILGQVPAFSFVDEQGHPFGSADLAGKVWVADFFFSRCPTICPRLNAKMAEIRHRGRNLAGGLHLVSFSVDPDYDTPAVLHEYAKRFAASPATWSFLTGPLDAIEATVVSGLKMVMGNDGPPGSYEGIFHGSHFVVVDAHGRIRAYVDANDDDAVERVIRAVAALVAPEVSGRAGA